MKIFLIVLISLILIILIGYVYIHNKMIDTQEKSFKRLESAEFKESPRHFTGFIALTEDSFWRLIDDSRAKNQESFDSQMDYLILQLSNMTDDEIIGFEKRLREKMIELWNYNIKSLYQILFGKYLSFGGMWRWRRVAVARVFALVVRCRVMMLFVYCRVGKNRDTRRESPAGAGAGRTADHLTVLFSLKILAVRKANDIYRPVTGRLVLG